jgi:hypothetical protein
VNIFEARRVKYQAIRNSISFVVEKCFDEFNFLNIVGYVTYMTDDVCHNVDV